MYYYFPLTLTLSLRGRKLNCYKTPGLPLEQKTEEYSSSGAKA
jgi:hypothetical protein